MNNLHDLSSLSQSHSAPQMRLFYYMYGATVDSLRVYTRTDQGLGGLKQVFSRSGNLGEQWVRTAVTLTETKPFQVN